MAINATNDTKPRELIPAGLYVARCYEQIHIGHIKDEYMGQERILNKVRVGWELPTELRVFKQENGEQPLVISKEYTLFMNEKSNLRKDLESWRGKPFTEDQAKSFDITVLIGKECMINITHKVSAKGNTYETISAITPLPKGFECPPAINPVKVWDYDKPDWELYKNLPQFITEKIESSKEWKELSNKAAAINQAKEPVKQEPVQAPTPARQEAVKSAIDEFIPDEEPIDDLPF